MAGRHGEYPLIQDTITHPINRVHGSTGVHASKTPPSMILHQEKRISFLGVSHSDYSSLFVFVLYFDYVLNLQNITMVDDATKKAAGTFVTVAATLTFPTGEYGMFVPYFLVYVLGV